MLGKNVVDRRVTNFIFLNENGEGECVSIGLKKEDLEYASRPPIELTIIGPAEAIERLEANRQ